MPRGAPDYSNVRTAQPIHRLDDMSELAARLHSPSVYDRGGKVVFLSRFGRGLGQFGLSTPRDAGTIVPSPTTFLTGPFSMKFTTSDVSSEVFTAWVRIPVLEETTKLGLEAAFCIPDGEVGVGIKIAVFDAPARYEYDLTYWSDVDQLRFTPEGPGEIVDEDLALYEGLAAWHRIKLVVDLDTKMYVRGTLNENVYDLSEYYGFEDTTNEDKRIDIRILSYARENATKVVYWDDVIVTQHEP